MIYLVLCFQFACLGAFTCGLSLTNQHTIVVYVAFMAVWVIVKLRNMHVSNKGNYFVDFMAYLKKEST